MKTTIILTLMFLLVLNFESGEAITQTDFDIGLGLNNNLDDWTGNEVPTKVGITYNAESKTEGSHSACNDVNGKYIDLKWSMDDVNDTSDLTIVVDFNKTSATMQMIMGTHAGGLNTYYLRADAEINYRAYYPPTSDYNNDGSAYNTYEWNNVIWVFSPTAQRYWAYLNGVLDMNATYAAAFPISEGEPAYLFDCRYQDGPPVLGPSHIGCLDNFCIFRGIPSVADVAYINTNGCKAFYDTLEEGGPIPNIVITTKDKYDNSLINTTITISNSTFTNTSNTTNGVITFYVSDGVYNISIEANNYFTETFLNWNSSNDLTANLTYYKARFKAEEKVIDYVTKEIVNNFTMYFYYSDNDTLETTATSSAGNISAELSRNNTYYSIVDSVGYTLNNFSLNSYDDYTQSENISLFPYNSINIHVRDEETNNLITSQIVNIQFSTNDNQVNYNTNNGTLLVYNLTPTNYLVKFNTSGYSIRTYSVTVSNQSTQSLTAYLTESISTVIFTIKDKSSLDTITDVSLTMYRFINTSWVPIESKYSDITGRVQVVYKTYTNYKFYLAKSRYEDFIFYLNPVLFSEYTIQMTKINIINATQDYNHISIIYAPKQFLEGSNNFTFIIQSPFGELINYGYNLTYPNGKTGNYGTNALGSQLESTFTITTPSITDRVKINWYYETSTAGLRNFTAYYPIQYTGGNYTMAKACRGTYGLGLIERVIITVIIGILIIGIASLYGHLVSGVVICFLVWGYLVYTGFISIWLVIISIVIGVLYLSLKGES